MLAITMKLIGYTSIYSEVMYNIDKLVKTISNIRLAIFEFSDT